MLTAFATRMMEGGGALLLKMTTNPLIKGELFEQDMG